MQAYKKDINEIFPRNKILEVPFYQRAYVWGQEEWERLLEDVINMCRTGEEYFLGSVILKDSLIKGDNPLNFAGRFVVIDGQQRLTTLMILVKILSIMNNDEENFDDYFLIKTKNGKIPALQHNFKNKPTFEKIMALDELDDLDEKDSIVEAYNFFKNTINEETAKVLDLRTIFAKLVFVMITVDDNEDEQQIFDTINSLGVRLTTAELLKNFLFSNEDYEKYCNSWKKIFEEDPDTRLYWEREIYIGNVKRAIIDIFFDSLLKILINSPNVNLTEEQRRLYDRTEKLFYSYRDIIENKKYFTKEDFIEKIEPYALIFREVFNPDVLDTTIYNDNFVDRINLVIFGLQCTPMISYILYLRRELKDDSEFNDCLHLLESFIARRTICRYSTRGHNKFFDMLIKNHINCFGKLKDRILNQKETVQTKWPDDNEVIGNFHEQDKLTSAQARGILYLLEVAVRPAGASTSLNGFDSYSLEHLMPKKWRNYWDMPDDPDGRDDKLLTLGNLAIIPQRLNASIRDSSWEDKKRGNERFDGLKLCSGGLKCMETALECDVWDEFTIDKRADELCNYALNEWKII